MRFLNNCPIRLFIYLPILMMITIDAIFSLSNYQRYILAVISITSIIARLLLIQNQRFKINMIDATLIYALISIFVIGIFSNKIVKAEPIYQDLIVKINRVYDGDTIFVDIPNIPDVFGKEVGVRIHGIDAPEIRGACSREKELASTALDLVTKLIDKERFIILKNVTRDKYFRIDADIILNDGSSVADILLKAGLAYPYNGDTAKRSWCE